MRKLLSMALALMMVLTLLAVPAMAADSINITEVNDYGTVVAEVGSDTITVVAETGYYLYSATLNGNDILASMTADYDDKTDNAVCPKEQWTYTAAAPLTAADELVVAYGYYTETPYVAGGDANTPLGTSGAWNTNGTCTIVNLDGNNVFLNKGSRLRSTGVWPWVVGDKWIVQYDAKLVDPAEEGTTARFYSDSTALCPNGRKYTLPFATADWTTYTTYVDIITADNDYVFFQTSYGEDGTAGVYYDNLKVAKLTKAGIVPTFCDINVTEVNDFGVVTADERVVAGAATTIKVAPEEGYYLHAAKVNGAAVDFTKAYETYDSATAWGYKEVWTYEIPEVTADVDVEITYGYYIYNHMYTGGDAESDTHNILNYNTQTNARTDAEASTGSYSFVYDGTRLKGPAFQQNPGDKFIIKYDLKTTAGVQRVYAASNAVMPNGRYYDYPATSTTWKSYTVYLDVNTAKNDYIYFQTAADEPTYYDNIVVAKLTEGGKVPAFYDITVEANGDYGTITADERVAEETATAIKVEPDFGYYLYGATVNGEAVEFTKTFEKVNEAGVFTKKEVWTYDVASVTEDLDVVITYGVYNLEELVVGGDGESATTNVQVDGAVVTAVAVEGEDNKAFIAAGGAGKLSIARWTSVLGERYVVRFDAKKVVADEATPVMYMYATGIGNWVVEGDGAEYTGLGNAWKSYTNYLDIDPGKFDSVSLYPNSGQAYVDNFSICRITEGGIAGQEPVTPPAPTTAAVTITGANAAVSVAADTVAIGEGTTFTAKPAFGYYIDSITIGGADFVGFDAYKGGTYETGAIEADTAIVVTTVSYAANDKGVATEVATLPEAFAADNTAVTFGKVLDNTGATSWGIELTKDGVGVTPYHGGSYLYRANATNANGQYAIEFIGLEAGTYTIRSYMYIDGTPVFGAPTTFVVD